MSPEEQQLSQQQSHLSEAGVASAEQQAQPVEHVEQPAKEQEDEPQDVHQQVQDIAPVEDAEVEVDFSEGTEANGHRMIVQAKRLIITGFFVRVRLG